MMIIPTTYFVWNNRPQNRHSGKSRNPVGRLQQSAHALLEPSFRWGDGVRIVRSLKATQCEAGVFASLKDRHHLCWIVTNFLAAILAALIVCTAAAFAADRFIILQSTTSIANSGLLAHLAPKFEAKTGIQLRVVAVGTGQALKNARNGDGDVLLVHAKQLEENFVAEGFGVKRYDVMYNNFIVVGPKGDPAEIMKLNNVLSALQKIAATKARFASRGDLSGTHVKELSLWVETDVDPQAHSGTWYLETGSGMGATLNLATGMGAYTLTDRATWIAFANKRDFAIMVEGDKRLHNQYGAILVNPKKHPHINFKDGQAFIDWLTSPQGQIAIAGYRRNDQQLFFPNAKKR